MSYEARRRLFLTRNMSLEEAARDNYYKNRFNNKTESEDTKLRKEIHEFIRQQLTIVKSRQELLDKLKEKFSDEKYQRYNQYFESWVSHAIREDEER